MKKIKSVIALPVVVTAGLLLMGAEQSIRRLREGIGPAASDTVDSPVELTKVGWKDALLRTKDALKDKQLGTQAAGLAYYTTLTFFPALLGAATIFATFAGAKTLLVVVGHLRHIVPLPIYDLIHQQLAPLANARQTTLGIAAVLSILALLWTTSGGLQNLIKALNVAYGVPESRGLIKLRLVSIALSAVLLVLGAAIIILLVVQGSALHMLGAPHILSVLFPYARWLILAALISLLLSVVYRFAPNRQAPRWSWVSWGAAAAAVIWLIGTALFFFYVQKFGHFNKTYGIFAGVIILMTWFNLSSLIILVGAQVNNKLQEVAGAKGI